MKLICPYKGKGRKVCDHKGFKPFTGKKKYCGYKFPHNCPYYVEWLEKSNVPHLKRQIDIIGDWDE